MGQVSKRLRTLWGRLHPGPAETTPLTLSVAPELGVLARVHDAGKLESRDVRVPGVVSLWRQPEAIEEAPLKAKLVGRTDGVQLPPWADGSGGAPASGVAVCRVKTALYAPEFGAVTTADGRVLHSSVAEALYFTPSLGALPYVVADERGPVMLVPSDLPSLARASVFMAWGGRFNYGHFLLDCLSALAVLAEEDLLDRFAPIAPPLSAWQRDALGLLLGPQAGAVREITSPLVKVGDLLFASPMDHFLHAPAAPLDRVKRRMLDALGRSAGTTGRIYLSRRKDHKRRLVNEPALEEALRARGFAVIHPEDLSVLDQIEAFRSAHVIVGPTGAAFANCLFCEPWTKVFEIQPVNFTGIWVRGLCHYVGADWHGYFVASPLEEQDVYVEGELRPGTLFEWSLPETAFLTFLDERL